METWMGTIEFDHCTSSDSITISLHDAGKILKSCLKSQTKLHFLSVVEVALIPFHLSAGPPFDVSTDSHLTEKWLSETLLCDWDLGDGDSETTQYWWISTARQSDKGILLRVDNGAMDTSRDRHYITEILIYAAILNPSKCTSYVPAYPASSSPDLGVDFSSGEFSQKPLCIKFFALPLSSQIYNRVNFPRNLSLSPSNANRNEEGSVLALLSENDQLTSLSSQQRQQILTKFEDATYERKRLVRHGGESVSKAMAVVSGPVAHETYHHLEISSSKGVRTEHQGKVNCMKDFPNGKVSGDLKTPPVGVSKSFKSKVEQNHRASSKRSSSHHVDIVASSFGCLAQVSSNNTEQQNKDALARIIMAGMRIYGLKQRKKSRKPSFGLQTNDETSSDSNFVQPTPDEEEFKLVYHQTFKAASFTFRAHLSNTVIDQETMRDVVDRHLDMFCNDPLEAPNASHELNLGAGQNSKLEDFGFSSTDKGDSVSTLTSSTKRRR